MKKLKCLLLLIIIVCLFGNTAHARTYTLEDMLEEQSEASGAYELPEALPDETAQLLEDAEISPQSMQSGEGIAFEQIMELLSAITDENIKTPLSVSALIVGLTVICAVLEGMKDAAAQSVLAAPTSSTAAIAICSVVTAPVVMHISSVAKNIEGVCDFSAIFIPIYSAICAATGHVIAASGYGIFVLSLTEGVNILISAILIPLTRVFLAIAIVSAVSPTLRLDGVIDMINKNVRWILGLISVLFVGVLGISTTAAASIDSATAKTAKFVVSSTVPIIGGAMSDAIASVSGCVEILRSSVGGFGIIAMAFIFLPSIVRTILWILGMNVCNMLAQMLDVKPICKILTALSGTLSLLLSVLIFVAVTLLAASATMLGRGL